jgi:hypothetical protein
MKGLAFIKDPGGTWYQSSLLLMLFSFRTQMASECEACHALQAWNAVTKLYRACLCNVQTSLCCQHVGAVATVCRT